MTNPLKIENSEQVYLITTRTIGSRLWFIHNQGLHLKILAFLARYQEMYGVILYGFVLMGNHYHLIARFPHRNKSAFMRIFNSMIARLVAKEVPNYIGGRLWARRYSDQVLPNDFDITHWFLYVVLNPLTTGICSQLSDYSGYTSLYDCLSLRPRTFEVFERWKYNEAKRNCAAADPEQYLKTHTLTFSKLPQFENLSDADYRTTVRERVQARQEELAVHGASRERSLPKPRQGFKPQVGDAPLKTKTGSLAFGRPLVLSLCAKSREAFLEFYFAVRDKYREASLAFRSGSFNVSFPPGTYRPILFSS